jgi:hypothetical protein
MNPSLIKTEYLATGQTIPFTGEWVSTALCKNGLIVTYSSGASIIANLEGRSLIQNLPAGASDAYTFYTQSGLATGYADPVFFDSPITEVRMVVNNGNGKVWSYLTYQN